MKKPQRRRLGAMELSTSSQAVSQRRRGGYCGELGVPGAEAPEHRSAPARAQQECAGPANGGAPCQAQ